MSLYLSHRKDIVNNGAEASSDTVLWDRVKDGDQSALAEIYHLYVGVLYRYGTKICSDRQLVEDTLHDLFVDIWRIRQRLVVKDSLKFYLISAFRRRLVQCLVKHKKQIALNASFDGFDFVAESREAQIIGGQADEEHRMALQKALSELTKRQREAIYLRFFNNLSYEEVSEMMGISVDATYNLISKAIQALKQHMVSLLAFWTYFFL